MSIAVLNQVYDEVRRLSIAGSNLASGDFRLKNLIEPLQKSAKKAPVFGKVADAIQSVVDSTQKDSAHTLLELTTLTTAILYTQGETSVDGKFQEIKSQDLGLTVSNTSARILKPLIEALTTTGSGRLEIIRDAYERGSFKDLRLIKHAIDALDDKYGEVGDFVADNVLPIYGTAIYPEILEGFDLKGKGDDARRLRLLNRLDAKATQPIVDEALEDGSKEVKLQAINCLQGRSDSVEFLLTQVKARSKDIRRAALQALSIIDKPKVIEVLKTALSGPDVELVASHVAANKNKELKAFVVEAAERSLEELLATEPKKKASKKTGGKKRTSKTPDQKLQLVRFYELLRAFRGRSDKAAIDFLLTCFDRQQEIQKLKAAGYVDGDDINRRVTELMLLSGSKPAVAKLVETDAEVTPELVTFSLLATSQVHSSEKVFELFSPSYHNRPTGKNKADRAANFTSEAIGQFLLNVENAKCHTLHGFADPEQSALWQLYGSVELDPRWLDVAVELQDQQVILTLAKGPHLGVWKFLSDRIDRELKKKTWNPTYDLDECVEAMITTQHPELVPKFIKIIERTNQSKRQWMGYYLVRLMVKLPKEAIKPLEELVPNLKDNFLDVFVGALDELKQAHKA